MVFVLPLPTLQWTRGRIWFSHDMSSAYNMVSIKKQNWAVSYNRECAWLHYVRSIGDSSLNSLHVVGKPYTTLCSSQRGQQEKVNHAPSQSLLWRHNERDGVLNHQPRDCLLNRLFRRRSKKTWKFRVTGLCARNSPVTGEFRAQMASNAETVFIWWRHHDKNVVLPMHGFSLLRKDDLTTALSLW